MNFVFKSKINTNAFYDDDYVLGEFCMKHDR